MSDRPAILLVHGAWHGSWCWDRLVPLLTSAGRDVRTVDLPTVHAADKASRGLADDADAVRAAIAAVGGPVVVVAHSYGGAPASVASAGVADVEHLVYLTAFALDAGESLLGAVGGEPPSWWNVQGDLVTAGTADEPPAGIFYNDLSAEDAAAQTARLTTQSLAAFRDELSAAAWHDIPSTYVVCDRDAAIPAFAQEGLAARAGSVVHHLDASHSPFLSKPDETAEIILAAGA